MPKKPKQGARKPQGKMCAASTHAALFFNVLGRISLHTLADQQTILESLLVDLDRLHGIVNATLAGEAPLVPKARRSPKVRAPRAAVAFADQRTTPDAEA